jgi:RND family efflux transporter MFP subunit
MGVTDANVACEAGVYRQGFEAMQATEPAPAAVDSRLPAGRRWLGRRRLTAAVALGALVVLPFTVSLALRQFAESAPLSSEQESTSRVVRVVRPTRREDGALTLPANVDAFQTTLLCCRVTGYLRGWYADIGDPVKKGQPLADIDTPELDQELEQAQANLAQGRADLETADAELKEAQANLKQADADIARARANREFARGVLRRSDSLHARQVITDQERDESHRDSESRQADMDAALAQRNTREATVATKVAKIKSHAATVGSLEANVRRLEKLQIFKTITAPFDGVVTRRRAEIGSLVMAGSATSQELFAVAQTSSLRIRINVPQSLAASIETDKEAQVLVPEYPDRKFLARVKRTSQAIDPTSRTLAVEIELPNADHALLPGTFGQVILPVRRAESACTVPSNVLLNRPDGLCVAVVGAVGAVHLQKVKLGRDYGSTVEVLSGLRGAESLIINPPDDLSDGETVSIADSRSGGASPGASPTAVAEARKTGP